MSDQKPVSLPHDQQCPHCGRFDNRGLAVDAVIIRDNKVLLGKRKADPFKGFWALFGGYVEWDESVEEALARETKEESNLEVIDRKLIGVYSEVSRHSKQTISISYGVKVKGTPKAGDDIAELKWWSLDGLPELAFDHKKIIADYLKTL